MPSDDEKKELDEFEESISQVTLTTLPSLLRKLRSTLSSRDKFEKQMTKVMDRLEVELKFINRMAILLGVRPDHDIMIERLQALITASKLP